MTSYLLVAMYTYHVVGSHQRLTLANHVVAKLVIDPTFAWFAQFAANNYNTNSAGGRF